MSFVRCYAMTVDRDVAGLWMNQILQLTLGKQLLPACLYCWLVLLFFAVLLALLEYFFVINFSFPFNFAPMFLMHRSAWLQAAWMQGRAADTLLLWSLLPLRCFRAM